MKNILDLSFVIGGETEINAVDPVVTLSDESVVDENGVVIAKPVLDMINPFSNPDFVPEEITEIVA